MNKITKIMCLATTIVTGCGWAVLDVLNKFQTYNYSNISSEAMVSALRTIEKTAYSAVVGNMLLATLVVGIVFGIKDHLAKNNSK